MEPEKNSANNSGTENSKPSSAGMWITLLIILALIIGIGWYLVGRGGSTPSNNTAANTPMDMPAGSMATSTTYKDGTYTAEGDYQVHIGPEYVDVTLTLQNGIITDATVTGNPSADPTSVHYQNLFIGGFKQYVIGMNIASINLTKVSGSSLTPAGFDNALTKIEAQAQA